MSTTTIQFWATAGVSSRTISRYTTSIRIRPQWLQTTRTTRTSPPESISRPDSNPVISSGNSGSSPYLSAGNRSFRFSDIVQSGTHRDCQTVEAMVPQRKTVLHLLLNDTTQLNISWVVSSSVPGAGQPYLLRPFRYGNKFQCLCNLLIMACYQKYALFINFWFCIWFCIRLSDKERMRLQHFRVLFCRDLDILHKVRFLFVPCNLHNGNSWNPGLICVCSE